MGLDVFGCCRERGLGLGVEWRQRVHVVRISVRGRDSIDGRCRRWGCALFELCDVARVDIIPATVLVSETRTKYTY